VRQVIIQLLDPYLGLLLPSTRCGARCNVALSYGGAAATARLIHHGQSPTIRVADAAWHGVFDRDRKTRGKKEARRRRCG
jgi:hypothetical protein